MHMTLQGQRRAGFDDNALNLKSIRYRQGFKMSPRSMIVRKSLYLFGPFGRQG